MKIEVPVFNDDGSLSFTASLSENEVKTILQFGLNMAVAMGIASQMGILTPNGDGDEDFPEDMQLN